MSLFQKSVEKKYLNDLDTALIDKKYADFLNHFGNPEIQENIRNSKEEQYQGEFLIDLFVNILGYTKNPTPNFNLTTELKNISNSKKADGAILAGTAGHARLQQANTTLQKGEHAPHNVIAVIELKSTNTTDLDKIETQAFGYKNHHPKCKYVITSNFEKLRFYIQNAVDHVDFDLFNLTREQFSLMWLCLAKDNLLTDLPLKIKESSVLQEENITKKLYADYSKFREAIYNNLVKNNPETDKLLLFKKTQKLLDRFLFIFFAEDRLLLPPNSISEIVKQWADLKEKYDEYFPLYSRFKKYFGYMNTGYNGKKYDIYAYNGGLFKPDEVLDNITIDDDILYEHTLRLSNYDFETDVDVNILGHIFEHSLGEIENIQATIVDEPATPKHASGHLQASPQTSGEHAPRTTSKRKKDGIFYTPKYITKYIVENTVGKLCEEKRAELGIVDEEYAKGRKNRKKELVKSLDKKLDDYRNWLLTLTILDPACGSGAFLNQALEFLINEHRKIDELRGQLLGGAIIFSDITTDILEKNIYGVDLNEESVEIAKLSLWLRTAQKGRKLNTLSNNIKCGNSLIDDPEIAGDKAFNWYSEFPNIFQKKEKKAWHITTATHNSRYSQRMFDNYVKKGEPVWLSEKEEVIVTETIAEIVEKDKLNMVAYNICGDHAHMILACSEDELPKIIQKIKAMSARACNIAMGRTVPVSVQGEHAPRKESLAEARTPEHAPVHPGNIQSKNGEHAPRGKTQFHLWAEKFDGKEITSNEQLENTIEYIKNNRNKHQLPESKELQKLIIEMTCSRQHAFRTEYKGGFDVVIGNPPYVRQELIAKKDKSSFAKKYPVVFQNTADLYVYFYNLSIEILKNSGNLGFITPNKFIRSNYGSGLRNYLSCFQVKQIIDFGELPVFEDAATFPSIIIFQKTNQKSNASYLKIDSLKFLDLKSEMQLNSILLPDNAFENDNWILTNPVETKLLDKIRSNGNELGNNYQVKIGIKTGFNEAFVIDGNKKNELVQEDPKSAELIKQFAVGDNLRKYRLEFDNKYLILTKIGVKIEKYPAIFNHLKKYQEALEKRWDKGNFWYELRACDYYDEFEQPKIVYPDIAKESRIIYDLDGTYFANTTYFIPTTDKWLTGILNSKLVFYFYKHNATVIGNADKGGRLRWFTQDVKKIPIPEVDIQIKSKLEKLVEEIVDLNKNHLNEVVKFQLLLKQHFSILKISKKLQNWHELEFKDFLKELQKAKIKLILSEEAEWMKYFNEQKEKAQTIKAEIEKTDCEIDRMVYELYGLTDEEIKIVAKSV